MMNKNGVEYWTIHNLAGAPKRFKKIDGRWENSREAEAWMKSNEGPKEKPTAFAKYLRDQERDQERAAAKEEREKAARAKKLQKENASKEKIWQQVENAVGASFPDGDPIDHLSDFMHANNLTMADVDAAVAWGSGNTRRKGKKVYGLYDYLADLWDSHAGDQIHDAKNGAHGEDYSHEWFAQGNPWRSS